MSQPVFLDLDCPSAVQLSNDAHEFSRRLAAICDLWRRGKASEPLYLAETARLAQALGETLIGLTDSEPSLPVVALESLTPLSLPTKGCVPC